MLTCQTWHSSHGVHSSHSCPSLTLSSKSSTKNCHNDSQNSVFDVVIITEDKKTAQNSRPTFSKSLSQRMSVLGKNAKHLLQMHSISSHMNNENISFPKIASKTKPKDFPDKASNPSDVEPANDGKTNNNNNNSSISNKDDFNNDDTSVHSLTFADICVEEEEEDKIVHDNIKKPKGERKSPTLSISCNTSCSFFVNSQPGRDVVWIQSASESLHLELNICKNDDFSLIQQQQEQPQQPQQRIQEEEEGRQKEDAQQQQQQQKLVVTCQTEIDSALQISSGSLQLGGKSDHSTRSSDSKRRTPTRRGRRGTDRNSRSPMPQHSPHRRRTTAVNPSNEAASAGRLNDSRGTSLDSSVDFLDAAPYDKFLQRRSNDSIQNHKSWAGEFLDPSDFAPDSLFDPPDKNTAPRNGASNQRSGERRPRKYQSSTRRERQQDSSRARSADWITEEQATNITSREVGNDAASAATNPRPPMRRTRSVVRRTRSTRELQKKSSSMKVSPPPSTSVSLQVSNRGDRRRTLLRSQSLGRLRMLKSASCTSLSTMGKESPVASLQLGQSYKV